MGERVTTAGSLILAICALALLSPACSRDSEADQDGLVRDVPADTALTSISGTLSSGESLYASLVGCGLEASHVVRVLDALGEEVDLRRCRPGDTYVAQVDDSGAITSLCYNRGIREIYKVEADSAGYRTSKDEIPVVKVSRRVAGVVRSSLWEAFLETGEDPQIALKLADVFAWEIDFVTDPRAGDSFVIMFDELYCNDLKIGIGDVIGARYVNDGDEHLAFGFGDDDGTVEYYDEDGNSVRRVFLKSPLNYRRISSYFSSRRFHPILKIYRPHYGVDYAAPTGTPVVSIGDGRVVYAGWKGGFGRYVEIRHNNVYTSCYGHFSGYGKGVKTGVRVSQGQVVGYVGATGLATGPHLDFRIKKFGSYVNPLTIEYPRADPIDEDRRDEFNAFRDIVLKGLRYNEVAAADTSR
jgi:murein DD-endopeptidase MepM/ murein hydrolase activator NlpD